MGIINRSSKLIFDELIGTNSFDDVFKNSIRDYYAYGFKAVDQFISGKQTMENRWKIFSRIMDAKWYLEKEKNGSYRITLKTMEHGADNPMDDLYFLHNLSEFGGCLNYLLDLDAESCFRGTTDELPMSRDEIEIAESCKEKGSTLANTDEVEYRIIENWLSDIDERRQVECPVRMNKQLNLWLEITRRQIGSTKNRYTNLGNKLKVLQELGMIGNLKENPAERNEWMKKEWLRFDTGENRAFNSQNSGKDYWFKSPLTMSALVADYADSSLEKAAKFLEVFVSMCDFFSQYYPLGEVGTMLSRRCERQIDANRGKLFRFKHNYFQKTLYDYNLIDLLCAIENENVCLISYSHATNMSSREEIIIPLEIRISVVNGREYVLYYQVQKREIKALRLEFIDQIVIYEKEKIKSISFVKRTEEKEKKKILRKEETIKKQDLFHENANDFWATVQEDLKTAREMLVYIWGAEVSNCKVKENWKSELQTYHFQIFYNEETEKYIKNRLKNERRKNLTITSDSKGSCAVSVRCFPTKELRNWIRSFYMRVVEFPMEEGFSYETDIHTMWQIYEEKKDLFQEARMPDRNTENQKITIKYGYTIEGKSMPETEGHSALFNEFFSVYAVILANSILKCSSEAGYDFDQALMEEISSSLDYFDKYEANHVKKQLKNYALEKELIREDRKTRFCEKKRDYLYELLPLTKVEVRWLLTVLEDPLAKLFFSDKEIKDIVKQCEIKIPDKVHTFPINAVNYYDKYQIREDVEKNKAKRSSFSEIASSELEFLKKLYETMNSGSVVEISYKNWSGKRQSVICSPAWIEYSRRDDDFRIWYISYKKKAIKKINLSRIINIYVYKNWKYELTKEQKEMEEIYKHTMTRLKIEFYHGNKNLPDRILTEFSLWKKKCVYDVENNRYQMTLYYSSLDEKEVLIRLLSFGPYIRIVNDDGDYVEKEMIERINKQREILTKEGNYL